MATTYAASEPVRPAGSLDLAAHFMECGALDTNLSIAPGERLIITDDFLNGSIADFAAVSMAAVVARDGQVGRAAIIPLSVAASKVKASERAKYERLFALIEETAFDAGVRGSAEALLAASFRESQIRELAAELGGTVGPARARYRAFLDIVKMLMEKKISEPAFLDEFLEFTRTVAGKLDFGIYSLCVDRLFVSPHIPLEVKASLFSEVMKYPPLVRKELVTNLLSSPQAPRALVDHARAHMGMGLTKTQVTEIVLFTMLKQSWHWQKLAPGRPTI